MAKVSEMTVQATYWAFRFGAGDRVVLAYPDEDRSPEVRGRLGTVIKAYHQGAYAYDRYLRFPVLMVDFDAIGTGIVSESELALIARAG